MEHQNSNEEPILQDDTGLTDEESARREFLKKTGRFAAVTPAAMTFLLGTTLSSRAIAASSGTRPGNGWGDKNHSHSGPPGRNR
jgi:hypothetical protein